MDDETLQLLVDLHMHNKRQGPGGSRAFARMLELADVDTQAALAVADIGCGTGSSTIPLLQQTHATVTAVELVPAFLEQLSARATDLGVQDRLVTCVANMTDLPFHAEQFDIIWSEGAIYNIGFTKGVRDWRKYLKPGGMLVVSELTWLSATIPKTLRAHWEREYPEVAPASTKMLALEEGGYSPCGYFVLPPECWQQNYYEPLQAGFADFLQRHDNSAAAKAVVEAERKEIKLYQTYKNYYSYGVYVARAV